MNNPLHQGLNMTNNIKSPLYALTTRIALYSLSASIVFLSVGCSTTSNSYDQKVRLEQERSEKLATKTVNEMPNWMITLPQSGNAIYENGTAVSTDLAMADLKAKTIAYSKLCMSAGGKVSSQVKIYRLDGDASSSEHSEMASRSSCPGVDISGVETVSVKHIPEGGRYRSYVLVSLPTGSANTVKSARAARDLQEEAKVRAPNAFNELNSQAKSNNQ